MNKRQNAIMDAYNRHFRRTLYDCYANPSAQKVQAWERIKKEMSEKVGIGLTVISYNTNIFTCAYLMHVEEHKTVLVYITPTKRETIPV